MLILTRPVGKTVVIGEGIYCTVLNVRGKQVELGFDAPPSLSIHREEVYERILNENKLKPLMKEDDSSLSIIDRFIARFKHYAQRTTPSVGSLAELKQK